MGQREVKGLLVGVGERKPSGKIGALTASPSERMSWLRVGILGREVERVGDLE